MASIRNQLLGYLEQFANDDARLIEKLHDMIVQQGKEVYTYIFQILTNLDLPPAEAEEHWNKIISHSKNLSLAMGRK